MEVNIYNIFKDNNLVDNYKEYSELIRLKCVYVNEERIETPVKIHKLKKKVKNIRLAFRKIII